MKFGNEFWQILFREYITPKLFAVLRESVGERESGGWSFKEIEISKV
jgi:hypothetical protein